MPPEPVRFEGQVDPTSILAALFALLELALHHAHHKLIEQPRQRSRVDLLRAPGEGRLENGGRRRAASSQFLQLSLSAEDRTQAGIVVVQAAELATQDGRDVPDDRVKDQIAWLTVDLAIAGVEVRSAVPQHGRDLAGGAERAGASLHCGRQLGRCRSLADSATSPWSPSGRYR